LNIPINTTRRANPAVSKLKALSLSQANYLNTIRRKVCENSLLQLGKRRDIERNVVVEQSDTAPDYGAPVDHGKKGKANAWRKVIFARYVIAIITSAIFECQPSINCPLVLKVSEELSLVPAELAAANKIELLASRAVRSKDTYCVAGVASIKRHVTDSAAQLHEVLAGEMRCTETVKFLRLITFASSLLRVEEVSGIHIRRQVHRFSARTRENVSIELLDAE